MAESDEPLELGIDDNHFSRSSEADLFDASRFEHGESHLRELFVTSPFSDVDIRCEEESVWITTAKKTLPSHFKRVRRKSGVTPSAPQQTQVPVLLSDVVPAFPKTCKMPSLPKNEVPRKSFQDELTTNNESTEASASISGKAGRSLLWVSFVKFAIKTFPKEYSQFSSNEVRLRFECINVLCRLCFVILCFDYPEATWSIEGRGRITICHGM